MKKKRRQIIVDKIVEWPPIDKLIVFSKRLVLPGFDKVPFFDVISFFVKGLQKGHITTRAAAAAYSFFLAIFPAILFFFTIIPYLPIENGYESVMEMMRSFIPENAFATIESTVQDIIGRRRGGLLSVGAFLALYFSTNGISRIIVAFNQTYHYREKRPVWKVRITALFLVILMSVIIIVAVLLIVYGTEGMRYLKAQEIIKGGFSYYLIQSVRWIVILAMVFFIISFIYYMAPGKGQRFRLISAGSSLATLLSIITSLGFDVYVQNFSRYNALYGSIGTLMLIMLWIYFNAIILLIGFELNASIQSARSQVDFNKLQEKFLKEDG